MARYGEEHGGRGGGYDAGYGRGYDTGDFRRWGEEGRRDDYDRGYRDGWGMTGLYYHMMRGRTGRGRGSYSPEYDSPFGRIAVGQPRQVPGGEGRRRFLAVEGHRERGRSDFRVGYGGDYAGYRGGRRGQGSRGSRRGPGWWG